MSAVADSLAAIGTLGAFTVAASLYAKDRATRSQTEQRLRSEQARHVSIDAPALGTSGSDGQTHWKIEYVTVVHNRSEDVITDAVVRLYLSEQYSDQPDPSGLMNQASHTEDVGRLDGRGERSIGHMFTIGRTTEGPDPHTVHVVLTFTDAAGIKWKRDEMHSLTEIQASN